MVAFSNKCVLTVSCGSAKGAFLASSIGRVVAALIFGIGEVPSWSASAWAGATSVNALAALIAPVA